MLIAREPTFDVPVNELPLIELSPAPEVWVDGIAPIEIIGHGQCFRTPFYALTKLDGRWVRVVVWKQIRAIAAYQRNQLGDMIAAARKVMLVH